MAATNDGSPDNAAVLPIAPGGTGAALSPVVGWLVDHDPEHGPRVDWPDNARGPTVARSTVQLSSGQVQAAVDSRRGAVLLFEHGRTDLPIIIGLLAEGPTVEGRLPPAVPDATVDGRRVRLDGADEIVLRCGQASIVLRRNGRVVIRGTYVETRSAGTNRIKGGSVQIN